MEQITEREQEIRNSKIRLAQISTPQTIALLNIAEFNYTGYAGVLPNGNIVDRRLRPEAMPIQKNSMFGIPEPLLLEEKPYHIWMEGYSITGNSSGANCITEEEGPIIAYSFDAAVHKYMEKHPDHGIHQNTPSRYGTPEGYVDRRSNWNIWACDLFDNKEEARKSFG